MSNPEQIQDQADGQATENTNTTEEVQTENNGGDWETVFDGQTPGEVKKSLDDSSASLQEWKGHARTWETRAKKSASEVDELKARVAELEGVEHPDPSKVDAMAADLKASRLENALWRELTRAGVDAHRVMDSRSFMASVEGLDPDDEGFRQDINDALSEVPSMRQFSGESPADSNGRGMALFERIHGKK